MPQNIDYLFELLERFPAGKEVKINRVNDLEGQLYRYENFLDYFQSFGLWDVLIDEERSNQPGQSRHKRAKAIVLTPLYKSFEKILLQTWDPFDEDQSKSGLEFLKIFTGISLTEEEEDNPSKEERKELFLQLVKPLFSEKQFNLTLTKKQETFVKGKYLLKVKIDQSSWRTLQLGGDHTLLDLHKLIQKGFELSDDHLYAFYMDGKKFSKDCFNSSMDYQGPYVKDAKIGSLGLYEGKRFLYLYDFGAEWEFYIDVMKISETEEVVTPEIRDAGA